MKRLKKQLDKIKPQFEKGGRFQKLHSVFDGFYTFLYTPNETSASGVHIHDANDSKRTMITVIMALLPCCLFGMWNIGYQHSLAVGIPEGIFQNFIYGLWAALPNILVAYIVGLGIEFIFAQLRGHEIQEGFLVSGLLIPMICPVETPAWMLAVATAFAVIFAKEVFGGTGYNFLNVALVTRAFLFFAYPTKMSGDAVFVSLGGDKAIDAFSGATPLGQLASAASDSAPQLTDVAGLPLTLSDMFWGFMPGSWGETSTFCILIGAVILLATGMASWRIMLSALIGGVAMSALVDNFATPLYPATMLGIPEQLCLGGFMFAIVFMATDPVTACRTNVGKWIYGFLIGTMAIIIRCFNTGFPEGAMLSVLLMNCFAPLIDYCVVNSNIKRRLSRAGIKS